MYRNLETRKIYQSLEKVIDDVADNVSFDTPKAVEMYEDYLDGDEGCVICGKKYYMPYVLNRIDPVAYRRYFFDFIDSYIKALPYNDEPGTLKALRALGYDFEEIEN